RAAADGLDVGGVVQRVEGRLAEQVAADEAGRADEGVGHLLNPRSESRQAAGSYAPRQARKSVRRTSQLPRRPRILVGVLPRAGWARVTGTSRTRKPHRAARIAR